MGEEGAARGGDQGLSSGLVVSLQTPPSLLIGETLGSVPGTSAQASRTVVANLKEWSVDHWLGTAALESNSEFSPVLGVSESREGGFWLS